MGTLVLNGATSGATTLQPTDATTQTITFPANSGTVITTASSGAVSQSMLAAGVAGNGPAFSVYLGANQGITAGVETIVQLNTKEFDTANCFNTSNYKFTPNVAGYYQFNCKWRVTSTGTLSNFWGTIQKNGSTIYRCQESNLSTDISIQYVGSHLVYMNGTTDYIQISAFVAGAGSIQFNQAGVDNQYTCALTGFLARAA